MKYSIFSLKNNSTIDYLLVFMLVFAFPLLPFLNSAKIAIFLIFLRLYFAGDTRRKVMKTISSKRFLIYILIVVFFSSYTLFLTSLKEEYDLSLFKKQFSSVVYTILTIIFFVTISKKNRKVDSLIFFAFFLQSIFIILAIVSPEFYELTTPFRKKIEDHHFEAYGRLRGAAISGYQFFGISTMYGIFILYCIIENKIKGSKKLFAFLLIIITGLISGRFTIVAILLGFFVKFIFNSTLKKQIKMLIKFSFIFILLSLTLYYSYENYLDENTKNRINFYLVSPVEGYFNSGELSTTSTDTVLNMYESFNLENILTGDGRYEQEFGHGYYGKVDVGYLRILYYYGVFGLLTLFGIQYLLITRLLKLPKDKIFFSKVLFVYFIILNLKGDVFFYSNNTIPLIIGLVYYTSNKNTLKNDNDLIGFWSNEYYKKIY